MGNKKRLMLAVCWRLGVFCFLTTFIHAQLGETPRPQIRLELDGQGQALLVHLDVPANHHITDIKYGFFTVTLAEHPIFALGEIQYPSGESYGDETVHKGSVTLRVPLLIKQAWTAPQELSLKVSWQMCQEKPLEMCFAPDEQDVKYTLKEAFIATGVQKKNEVGAPSDDEGFVDGMIKRFQLQLQGRSIWAFLTVFLLGFLTSLTPCVYPVIPVIMGFVGARSQGSKARAFSLSLFFVLGLALVYSLLGVIAAQTGAVIGASFQNPIFVIIIALVFVAMGLSMAGLFDIPVPAAIAAKAHSGAKRNQWLGAIMVGAVSGFIAAPCAGPVVIALVTFISQTSDLLLGFGLMFAFALGMGIIFLLVGTFSGLVGTLPQGGGWMEKIKLFFALMLIGAGIYFIGVVSPGWVAAMLWGVFLIGFSLLAGVFDSMPEEMPSRFLRLLLVLVLLLGAFLFFEGLWQARHGQAPALADKDKGTELNWQKDIEAAISAAKSQNKVLMVDGYADWCVACKELDHETFSHPIVVPRLEQMVLLKLDLTKKNPQTQAMRQRFGIIAMPTVVFYTANHQELARFSGFKTADELMKVLDRL